MPILIVFSGFMAIVIVGSVLVAVNDAVERFVARRMGAKGTGTVPTLARRLAGRGGSRRRSLGRAPGRRTVPREVVVVHAGRISSADA